MRKFLNRISVYRHIPTADGYGGNTLTESSLGASWCSVEPLSGSKQVAFGLDITKQTIRLKMRYRADLDYSQTGILFKWKNRNWQPVSFRDADAFGREVEIIAINVTIDNMPEITYVPVDAGSGVKLIDGFTVKKADGNEGTGIEVGDFIYGWFGEVFAAGVVNSIPVATIANIDVAVSGQSL